MAGDVSFIRNNIDHYTGATFGCHENYLVRRSAPLTEANVLSLLTFLTLRLLFTGAGRVGTTLAAEWRGELSRPGTDGVFQMSQRADYINNDLYEWVQFNRSIINTRDEPLGDPRKYRRLHLLHGDTSVLPATLLLKVGTTSLMLDLLEINHLPKIVLADAVKAFRALSHQPEGPWEVKLADGRTARRGGFAGTIFRRGLGGISRARRGDGHSAGCLGFHAESAGRPSRRRSSAKWIGSPSIGCCRNFWNRKSWIGTTRGSRRRTWNFITLTRRAAWAWR